MPSTRDGVLGKWISAVGRRRCFYRWKKLLRSLPVSICVSLSYLDANLSHLDNHHHVHMFPADFPDCCQVCAEEGLRCGDRQMVFDLPVNLRTTGFSSAFYGEEISESLFLQVLDDSSHRGERSLEVMCHPAFIDNTIRQSAYCLPSVNGTGCADFSVV